MLMRFDINTLNNKSFMQSMILPFKEDYGTIHQSPDIMS
jgi:hypothetical protein